MSSLRRLEDLRRDWQKLCAGLIETGVEGIVRNLEANLPDPVNVTSSEVVAKINETTVRQVRQFCEVRILPLCLGWLQTNEHMADQSAGTRRVHVELTSALENLPEFHAVMPGPTTTLSPWRWLIPAGGGAIFGALLFTPLSMLLLANREVGLFLGSLLGTLLAVALFALLATRPGLLSFVRTALGLAGSASLLAGILQAWKGRSFGLLKASGYLFASLFLCYTLRLRIQMPSRSECLDERLKHQLRNLLQHDIDVILAWCWGHPDRAGTHPVAPTDRDGMDESMCAALTSLRGTLRAGSVEPDAVQDAANAVIQRAEEQGYEWKTVERGTPFTEDMQREFDKYALISVGQPVETLQPAILRRGEVIRRGTLRRANA